MLCALCTAIPAQSAFDNLGVNSGNCPRTTIAHDEIERIADHNRLCLMARITSLILLTYAPSQVGEVDRFAAPCEAIRFEQFPNRGQKLYRLRIEKPEAATAVHGHTLRKD